jgi:hypothetical protein
MGAALACLFFLIPLCNLPPARFGYYNQVESTLLAFWFFSFLSSVWIYFLWAKNPRVAELTFRLPLVWGPLLLGVATILISPFHDLPLKDFTGSPHIGEGAITFMATGIMAAHFAIVSRVSAYRKAIFGAAFLCGLIVCSLTILGSMESPFLSWRYWNWAPFVFPDFMGYIDIALICIYFYWRKNQNGFHFLTDSVALLFFALVTYYASNKSLGYGFVIAAASTLGIRFFPLSWRHNLLRLNFFFLTLFMTLVITFYDDLSLLFPMALSQLSTLTSRTWLSKVTIMDLWHAPLTWDWVHHMLIGKGWGSFSNTATANMFLIDQISLFSGKDYNPSWEIVNRDLLHTHNILTSYLHSVGLLGVSLYLYIQYHLINSLSRNTFFMGAFFLICYQIQLLFWFQFILTVPFVLLAFSLFFKQRSGIKWSFFFGKRWVMGFAACLLIFTGIQSFITLGYEMRLKNTNVQSNEELINELTSAPYLKVEVLLGAQRQVALCRIYATALQEEFKKPPQQLVKDSLKIVNHLKELPREGNYLANNLAINILSELASAPETLKLLDDRTLKTWERLARDHIAIMPYRSDILLPFFNLYQSLGKEAIVVDLSDEILEHNPNDVLALWFRGSSFLKDPSRFNEGMCQLKKAIKEGVERFMPVPPTLKSKVTTYKAFCPQEPSLN